MEVYAFTTTDLQLCLLHKSMAFCFERSFPTLSHAFLVKSRQPAIGPNLTTGSPFACIAISYIFVVLFLVVFRVPYTRLSAIEKSILNFNFPHAREIDPPGAAIPSTGLRGTVSSPSTPRSPSTPVPGAGSHVLRFAATRSSLPGKSPARRVAASPA